MLLESLPCAGGAPGEFRSTATTPFLHSQFRRLLGAGAQVPRSYNTMDLRSWNTVSFEEEFEELDVSEDDIDDDDEYDGALSRSNTDSGRCSVAKGCLLAKGLRLRSTYALWLTNS